jgi:hypothetical protein
VHASGSVLFTWKNLRKGASASSVDSTGAGSGSSSASSSSATVGNGLSRRWSSSLPLPPAAAWEGEAWSGGWDTTLREKRELLAVGALWCFAWRLRGEMDAAGRRETREGGGMASGVANL